MAEGWARHLKGDAIEPYSAGIEAHGLNPLAVKVMAEVGVDISKQRSKTVAELSEINFDYVVTVCSRCARVLPVIPRPDKSDTCWFRRSSASGYWMLKQTKSDLPYIVVCGMKSGHS